MAGHDHHAGPVSELITVHLALRRGSFEQACLLRDCHRRRGQIAA